MSESDREQSQIGVAGYTTTPIFAYASLQRLATEPPSYGMLAGLPIVSLPRSWAFTPADARRLAACWNACQGIDTETLERKAAELAEKGDAC